MNLDDESIVRAVRGLASEQGWTLIPGGKQTLTTGTLEGRSVSVQHADRFHTWRITVGFGGAVARFDLLARDGNRGLADRLFYGKSVPLAHPQLEAKYILRTRTPETTEAKFSQASLVNLLVAESPALYEWSARKYGHILDYQSDQSESAEVSISKALTRAFNVIRCFEL